MLVGKYISEMSNKAQLEPPRTKKKTDLENTRIRRRERKVGGFARGGELVVNRHF